MSEYSHSVYCMKVLQQYRVVSENPNRAVIQRRRLWHWYTPDRLFGADNFFNNSAAAWDFLMHEHNLYAETRPPRKAKTKSCLWDDNLVRLLKVLEVGSSTQSTIAKLLGVSNSYVSRQLKVLMDRGQVIKVDGNYVIPSAQTKLPLAAQK